MNDKDLIKQLKSLKQVQPSKDWAIFARQNLISHINSTTETEENFASVLRNISRQLSASFGKTIPKPAMGLISIFFIITALAFVGFLGNTPTNVEHSLMVGSSSVAELTLSEPLVVEQEGLSGESSAPTEVDPSFFAVEPGGLNTPESFIAEQGGLTIQTILDQTYASLYIYDEDLSTAYKASLRERINRITVLAQEAENVYVEELAQEANELFADEDYDASLRVVVLAESLL